MAGTFLGEVNTGQLAGGPQTAASLIPQSADPAVNANYAQLYGKTDNLLYFEDVTGKITNILVAGQAVSNALGANTIAWPYGLSNVTGPAYMNSGASANFYKGVVAQQSGSIVGAWALGNSASATSGNIVVYKNASSFFTALTGVTMTTANAPGTPKYTTFPNGQYPVAPGDTLDLYYTNTGSGLYVGAGLIVNFGNTSISAVSTTLAANTTVAATDNQRVWQASSATQYVLTLPATNSTSDFYVRAVVVTGGGIRIQANTNQTIYNNGTASSSGGSISSSTVGAYCVLYNPAGTNIWTMTDPSTQWTTA